MRNLARAVLALVTVTVLTAAAWTAWLGWSPEYEWWRVAGLAATTGTSLALAARRAGVAVVSCGATLGMVAATAHDWPADPGALVTVGVMTLLLGGPLAGPRPSRPRPLSPRARPEPWRHGAGATCPRRWLHAHPDWPFPAPAATLPTPSRSA